MYRLRQLRITISIHALREEGDTVQIYDAERRFVFLSTPSARRATQTLARRFPHLAFLSTPSARRATKVSDRCCYYLKISIHALREEGDQACPRRNDDGHISIHALREEGDSKNREKTLCFCLIIYLSAQIAKRCL